MDNLRLDLKYALRTLRKNPLFSVLAILILALGIGAASSVFSFVSAFLLRPLPFAEPDSLVHVWETDRRLGWDRSRTSLPTFRDWQEHSELFEDLAVFNYTEENLTGVGSAAGADETPERIAAGRVSANVFELLGVRPILGRAFLPGEDQPGKPPMAVISDRFWRQRFEGSQSVLDQTVRFDDTEYTVVGVMPPGFVFPLPITQVWLPRIMDTERHGRDARFLQVVGRLKPGVSRAEAQAEMDTLSRRLEEAYPEIMEQHGANVTPLREALNFASEVIAPMSAVLLLAAVFLLLIVCANLANLMLSRSVGRGREISIRLAVGAVRGRLMRQLLTESLLLALAGGALGVLVAGGANRWLERIVPPDLYRIGGFEVDGWGLLFTLGMTLTSALFFGLMPALRASGVDVRDGLNDSRSGTLGRGAQRTHGFLVVAQICFAVVLLAGCSLMIRSLDEMRRVDPGFEAERVLSMKMRLPSSRYGEDERAAAFHREVLARVAALPGVEASATVDYLPLNHETAGTTFEVAGLPEANQSPPDTSVLAVSPDYFRVMGIALLTGRAFDGHDDADAPRVIVVNQAMARRYWPQGEAVGRRLKLGQSQREVSIVGVVADTRHESLDDDGLIQLYLPQAQGPRRYLRLLVRSSGDPMSLAAAVRGAVWTVDARLPITEVRTLAQVVEEFLLPQWALAVMLGVLGAGALVLASLGIYGVMAFFVGQRRREIAVRMAVGARREEVVRMEQLRGLRLAVAGVVLGLGLAVGLSQVMESLLFGIGGGEPVSFVGVPLFLVLVAALACLIPARRASRVDPMTILRYE